MNSEVAAGTIATDTPSRPRLDHAPPVIAVVLFLGLVVAGVAYAAYSLASDVSTAGHISGWLPYALLAVALLIALGFEFVNGFHDTANAVATVIYTHSMPAPFAVAWSGCFNFAGVLWSAGTVAFTIIALLPVELILQVGSSAGFAMVFALLIAAIVWNLGTWWLGLPASSSHTLIGSIIGVGIANALMHGRDGTSGVDWAQATKVGWTLLVSPVFGFVAAALLLLVLRLFVKNKALYEAPKGDAPPPWGIRLMLVITCTLVSFFHGSNDGQKGMGLIMLILVGTVPTAYALNRAMPLSQTTQFVAVAQVTQQSLQKVGATEQVPAASARTTLTEYIRAKHFGPAVVSAFSSLTGDIADQVKAYRTLSNVPPQSVGNVRNDMYLVSEAARFLQKEPALKLDSDGKHNLAALQDNLNAATRFIPLWVKVAVAVALGLGTMVGWKRIVITVGEKIGKSHLTYGQGAAAEVVAAATIYAADSLGMPVSTTHVLSSGVAGTMFANRSGLQLSTLRNLAMAWVLTLPAAILLSGSLYWALRQLFSHF
jgi:PiT family inorganic phosphate transporter